MISISYEKNFLSWLIPLSILLVGLFAHFNMYFFNKFDFDTYYMLMHADKGLLEFHKVIGFGFPLVVHAWISYGIFGYSINGFLLFSFLTSILVILITCIEIRRNWKSYPLFYSLILSIVIFNNHFLILTQYNYVYINTFFISVCLYFFFLRISLEDGFEKKRLLLIALLIIPLAFFSLYLLIIPIAAGSFSVIAFRMAKSSFRWNWGSLRRPIINMLPLIIFPIIYLIVYSIFPLTYITPEKRADFKPLFFYSSGFSKNVIGAVKYIFSNTNAIISGLLPIPDKAYKIKIFRLYIWPYLNFWILTIILAATIVIYKSRELDTRIKFTILYLISTYCIILFGGLAGIYPFGKIRYCTYLIVPFAVLLGYCIYKICDWLISKFNWVMNNKRVITIILTIIIMICGSFYNIKRYYANRSKEHKNMQAIEKIKRIDSGLILFSAHMGPIINVFAKDKYTTGRNMGWGTYWNFGKDPGVPPEVIEFISSKNFKKVKRISVVAPNMPFFQNQYSSWMKLIDNFFILKDNISAPSIWVATYERK